MGIGNLSSEPPSKWVLLKDFDAIKVDGCADLKDPPWLVARRFESSSVAAEEFIHDPLTVMMTDALTDDPEIGDQDALDVLKQIQASWHVSTIVTNHQATLWIKHLHAVVAGNPSNPSVGIMLVKQPPKARREGDR